MADSKKETGPLQNAPECCDPEAESILSNTQGKARHDTDGSNVNKSDEYKKYVPSIISFILLIAGIVADNAFDLAFFKGQVRLFWYGLAYIPVGIPVLRKGILLITKGKVFTEFFLMSVATIGAFFIGEYPEGVAVMLFYTIGELFQDAAVDRAKRSIKALLDIRPKVANVLRDGKFVAVTPDSVLIGEIIRSLFQGYF